MGSSATYPMRVANSEHLAMSDSSWDDKSIAFCDHGYQGFKDAESMLEYLSVAKVGGDTP